MIKAVIFDMFETLVTHYESPAYMREQIANDIGIDEQKFREIWDTSDDDRTLGKRTLENVIEEILKVNHCYSPQLFKKIITKRKKSKEKCMSDLEVVAGEYLYVGDGGSFELETAKSLRMYPLQAT